MHGSMVQLSLRCCMSTMSSSGNSKRLRRRRAAGFAKSRRLRTGLQRKCKQKQLKMQQPHFARVLQNPHDHRAPKKRRLSRRTFPRVRARSFYTTLTPFPLHRHILHSLYPLTLLPNSRPNMHSHQCRLFIHQYTCTQHLFSADFTRPQQRRSRISWRRINTIHPLCTRLGIYSRPIHP
jgi:hypothetical protein